MKVAFTGHRPPKGGLTYGTFEDGDRLAMRELVDWFTHHEPELAIVGGALGFDTLAARAAAIVGIDYAVYVPCEGQASRWPRPAQDRYKLMLEKASEVKLITKEYSPAAMQVRNERMVDDADQVVAWWDGSPGGTKNCVAYAKYMNKPVTNLYAKEA